MAHWRSAEIGFSRLSEPSSVSVEAARTGSAKNLVSGILNIDKPSGITSHDVVARIRRSVRQRRVGHAGTLDPLATGVLVICLGMATRLAEYLTRHDKSYRATVHLGISTDTYDADGKPTSTHDGPLPDEAAVRAALPGFHGTIQQIPPIYSAIKLGGQPLHRRVRRGESVVPSPRQVVLQRITLVDWAPPTFSLEVNCSAGTYIRSLAHDLGAALGCGAHLSGLSRLRSGRFSLDEALPLLEFERGVAEGSWQQHLRPLDTALADLDALQLTADETAQIACGQAIEGPLPRDGSVARAYARNGDFLAVVEYAADDGLWHPRKVFTTI